MTRAGRAFFGAMLGAALTLLIHPASRPYLLNAFLSPSNRPAVAQEAPRDVSALSEWMLAVGDKVASNSKLTPLELRNATDAAMSGQRLDPGNAYWRQMLACLKHYAGDEAGARAEWIAASTQDVWNDYQTQGLMRERARLAKDFGGPESWQLAYAYFQRNNHAVVAISSYARSLLASASLTTHDGLLLRAANIQNGALLRVGSHSIALGNSGAEMSEDACHPPGSTPSKNRHALYLARIKIQDQLRALNHSDLADQVHRIYNETDAWYAWESADEASDTTRELSLMSMLYVGLPSTLIIVGLLGVVLWFAGHCLRKLERVQLVPAMVAGIILGFGAFMITLLPLAAASVFLCCLFLTLGPKRERRVKVDDLGPMFSFTVGTLGLVFMMLMAAFILGSSAPAVSILPSLNIPSEYLGGSGVLLGLAIIILAILLLLAPLFAMALRVGTSFVLSSALKKFGAFLGFVSLVCIVVGTPVAIYLDRENAKTLEQTVLNEPVYYLSLRR